MAVFRAKTRDDISRSEKLRKLTRDIDATAVGIRALARKIAKPRRTGDEEARELVYTGAPGNYVTMTDEGGNFCVYRMKPAGTDEGKVFGVTDATRDQIRAINDANAKYWGNAR